MESLGRDTLVLVACILYLVLMVGIGALSARFSSAGLGEFFLAGRRLPAAVVALSAVVSGRSAWLLLGFSGMAFFKGILAVWAVIGYIVAELLLFLFVAPALRRSTAHLDALTIPDYLEARFGDRSHVLRLLSAIIIILFMTAYVSAQFEAGGKALGATFEIGGDAGLLITAGIVLAYTMLGGFVAVAFTDLVQAVFMIAALVVLPVLAVADLGGPAELLRILENLDGDLIDPLALPVLFTAGSLIGLLGIGLGSPGNPHILVRYMSVDDPRRLRVAAVVGTVWNTVMAWGALFIGLAGRAAYGSLAALPGADKENVFPTLAADHLHPFLLGLVLASVLAAIMSTADSQLLVAASAVVRDVYQKILKRKADIPQRRLVLLSRLTVAVLVAAAIVLGMKASEQVFWLVLFAWGGLGASFGPAILLALFWKGTTRWGVAAGLLTGTLTVILWKVLGLDERVLGQDGLYELIPAFFLSLAAIVAVSLCGGRGTRNPGARRG